VRSGLRTAPAFPAAARKKADSHRDLQTVHALYEIHSWCRKPSLVHPRLSAIRYARTGGRRRRPWPRSWHSVPAHLPPAPHRTTPGIVAVDVGQARIQAIQIFRSFDGYLQWTSVSLMRAKEECSRLTRALYDHAA